MPPCDTPAHFAPPGPDSDQYGPEYLERDLAGPGRQFQDAPVRTAHHADMTLAEVLRAVPAMSRRAPDQLRALNAALSCPDLDDVQDRKRRKLEAWIRIHVLRASWGGEGRAPRGVSSPGRDRVRELIRDDKTGKPISVTTYKRLRRWWEERGYIAIVREGWTPDLSPGVLRNPRSDHNTTQAYVICIPLRAEKKARRRSHGTSPRQNGPLSVFSTTVVPPTRTREEKPQREQDASCCYPAGSEGAGPRQTAPRDPALRVGFLARVSDGWFSHITRPFARLLGRPEVLLRMIDHYPDGRPHTGTDDYVRNPAAVLRWRLSHYVNPDGTLKPTPDEAAAERARRHREHQAAEHAAIGLAARSAQIRAEHGREAAAPAAQRPWSPPAAPQQAAQRITGWAVPRYGTAPAQAASGPRYNPSPEWEAAVAAMTAAAEAMEADARAAPPPRDTDPGRAHRENP